MRSPAKFSPQCEPGDEYENASTGYVSTGGRIPYLLYADAEQDLATCDEIVIGKTSSPVTITHYGVGGTYTFGKF